MWHSLSTEDALAKLDVDPVVGLSTADHRRRLLESGPNVLDPSSGPGALRLFARQFNNVLVWLLLAAAAISGFLLEEWIDTGVIVAIVVMNAVLGFVQESRAEQALAALEALTAPEAVVRRDGSEHVVPAADLVPGDIVLLEAGDRVPADARIIEAANLRCDEAALTGESFPVEKSIEPVEEESGTADRLDLVYSGTIITNGRAVVAVTETGEATEFGKVAELLDTEEPPTPLTVELDRVGRQIAMAALLIAAVIFALGLARQIAAETMFLTAVALAVAAIPEGLSAVVTVTLSRGVGKMAERSAIVRRLPAVEALGATTVICSDKTGTLTRNELRVQKVYLAGRDLDISDIPGLDSADEPRIDLFTEVAVMCNDARRADGADHTGFIGDPTEVAVVAAVDPARVDAARLRAGRPRLDEVPFDSERKRMSTLHASSDGFVLFTKGAPEQVRDRCAQVELEAGPVPFDDDRKAQFVEAEARFAQRGLRTLAFAYRPLSNQPAKPADFEEDLVLLAIVGMSDEIRPEAVEAVGVANGAGIEVVMITGDHRVTAETVARDLKIVDADGQVMSGDELRQSPVEELGDRAPDIRAYARVDPVDKVKIVHAWQANGAIVAMTGDGVNDAPALRSADIGIAMGSGTAVAREASSMVLADDNFATIVAAVREGRGIFANLKKVVYFLLSANISEVFVMLFGFMLFASYGEPLLATQLLWINLVTDGLPALALGFDPAHPSIMDRPPDRSHRILGGARLARLIQQGAVLAVLTLAAFVVAFFVRDLEFEHARTVTFTALVVVQLLHTYVIRSEGSSVREVGVAGNRLLAMGVAGSLALQLLVVYTPLGRELFEVTTLDLLDWLLVASAGVISLAINAFVESRRPGL